MIALGLLIEVVTTFGPAANAKPRTTITEAPCRRGDPNTITVCGRSSDDSPYRIPKELRDPGFTVDGPRDSVSRERHKLMDVGGAGSLQNACSTVGPMGFTGCMLRDWQAGDQQRGFRRR